MIKDTALYGGASNFAQLLGIVNSILLRRFMGPVSMGIWSILQVILNYCGYANLGTTKALMRDYPYLRGRGEHENAERLKDLVLTFSMWGSLIPAFAILGYLLMKGGSLEPSLRIGLIFMVGFLFIQRFYDILMALLRSDKKFWVLSQLTVLNAVLGLLVSLCLVSLWNIYGLFLGTALVTLACLFFVIKSHPYHFKYCLDKPALKQELILGVPLVAIAFLNEFLKSLDKWILADQLGFQEVGYYSIAMMASSYIYSLPMMFAHVWYPNLQEEYGRQGNAAGIREYLLKPVLIFSILCPFMCGIGIFLIPVLIHGFLPKFTPGILAMKIYLAGTFFMLLAQFGGNFLVTLDKYLINIPMVVVSIGTNYLLNMTFLRWGWGLEGVALGTALSFMVYGILSYTVAMKHFSSANQLVQNLFSLLLTLGVFFGAIFLIDRFVALPDFIAAAGIKTLLFTGFSLPFLFHLERKAGLFSHLGQLFLKRKPTVTHGS